MLPAHADSFSGLHRIDVIDVPFAQQLIEINISILSARPPRSLSNRLISFSTTSLDIRPPAADVTMRVTLGGCAEGNQNSGTQSLLAWLDQRLWDGQPIPTLG